MSLANGEEAAKKVRSRFGSWKNKVGSNRGLREKLEQVGGAGLEMFGYLDDSPSDIEYAASECQVW